jgi:hypothetical protein
MNMKEFLQACEDFFNQINPNIYDDDEEDLEDEENNELLNEDDQCFYNLCHMMRDTLLLINPRMKSN